VLHLRAGNSEQAFSLMAQAVQMAADSGLANLSPLAQVGMLHGTKCLLLVGCRGAVRVPMLQLVL